MKNLSMKRNLMIVSDAEDRVTTYGLATLASRVDPEGCIRDPKQAITAAIRLLQEAREAIERAHQARGQKEFEAYQGEIPLVSWIRALKKITGQVRRDRAEKYFRAYVADKESAKTKEVLSAYKRGGFPADEMFVYQDLFNEWRKNPKRKKGKQGRQIREDDARLRTELIGLSPVKPRKRH